MTSSLNPSFHYCKSADRNVDLTQTEGQCRERHNCSDGDCPLEKKFEKRRFSDVFSLLTPFLSDAQDKAQ